MNFVSIPYGTIKSRAWLLTPVTVYAVSIPYGTIKSAKANLNISSTKLFQFLMVRLKGIKK